MNLLEVLRTKKVIAYIFVICFVRIYQTAVAYPPQLDSDSGSYSSGNGLTNWNWVSISGLEHSRGWPTVFLFSLANDNSGKILIQQTLSILAWLLIGVVGCLLFKEAKIQSLWLLTVAFVSLNPISQKFNDWIGRESISLSLVLIALSLLILYCTTFSPPLLFFTCLALGLVMITKPTLMFISIAIFIIMLTAVFRNHQKNSGTKISMFFSLLILLYSVVNVSNQNQGWSAADPTGRTAHEIGFSYLISDFNPKSDELRNYLRANGAPVCSVVNPPSVVNNLGAPMDYAAVLRNNCEGFSAFVDESFHSSYLRYILTHPKSTIEVLGSQLGSALEINKNAIRLKLQVPIDYRSEFATWIFNLIVLVSALILLIRLLQILLGHNKLRSSNLVLSLILLGLGSLASISFSLLMQPTHTTDIARQNWVASSLLKFVIVVLALAVLQRDKKRGAPNVG